MPPPTNVTEFCGLLARTKLLTEQDVRIFHTKWKTATSGTDTDLDAFRKYLVQHRQLTEYQSALINRGHTDGFFIGGYVILDRIGKGQTAGVYKAVHSSGQVVALKVLPGSRAKQQNALNRFQREGRLLAQLDHPNVVRAYHVGQSGSVYFIAMEHLDGETLDEVLSRRKKFPPAEAVRIIYQALAGLQHLHEKRMVHRDLKPANLMLVWPDETGLAALGIRPTSDSTLAATVKILDIGIGREMFDEASPDTRDIELTSEGAILGTPDYMAPEQARDARGADVRADVYSLGCVLYHLIAGRVPFEDGTLLGLVVRHATEPLPPLPTGVPPGLQQVLDKMTAKSPEARFSTPAEAAAALTPFLPADAVEAAATRLVPAFQAWLGAESVDGVTPPVTASGSVPVKAGSRPHLKTASGVIPTPGLNPKGSSGAIPTAPPRSERISAPVARPLTPMATMDSTAELDVELLSLGSAESEAYRPLYDLNRRDLIMLSIGAGGVLAAVATGVGLSSVMRPKAEGK